ncbi:uncharacterized protein LOC111636649 [Centruroides sculpturatus]|uniref:uncharacterized protein LOC111636649 n=1 Tax=Centruroides sculpturatus TaxID=218467 RepID=UPI000C6DEB7C|nr:uncharacterized protein LOC111636649 [Centruroides sculpturatus]XP_023237802.1 uncharacterized protein LOC111636649 [Centruroides sculpturatus]
MVKLVEVWEIFEDLNDKWKFLLPITYVHFMYESCFFSYGAIFVKMVVTMRVFIVAIAFILVTGTSYSAWALSAFTSIIYDDFISLGKFYTLNLSREYKLKIVGFMKRFGGRPFGISIAGFFYVKRNFLIRMMSGFYSVFSSLIQVTGVLRKEKCASKIVQNFSVRNGTS